MKGEIIKDVERGKEKFLDEVKEDLTAYRPLLRKSKKKVKEVFSAQERILDKLVLFLAAYVISVVILGILLSLVVEKETVFSSIGKVFVITILPLILAIGFWLRKEWYS